ncbi:MAG: rpsP [Mycobacterium sp.]|nr:rpsP [Mycobacterium sp.]
MATKIKLMRLGKMRAPYYRIVVADSRTKRDGRVIETIGKYHPKEDPSFMEVNPERVAYWLSVGAQPTEPVAAILKVTGDWQKFKGEPAPAPMKVAAPKPDRKALFAEVAREAAGLGEKPATTPKAEKPAAAPKADKSATTPKAEKSATTPKAEKPATTPKAEKPAATPKAETAAVTAPEAPAAGGEAAAPAEA